MKKSLLYALSLITLLGVLFACQKETSLELPPTTTTPSVGSLKANALDSCLPKTVAGQYRTGTALAATNYIDVTVDVITPGAYVIKTDTINGFSFKGEGTFASAGLTTVKLNGTGTPVTAGPTPFVVRYDTSNCTVWVQVTAGTTPPTGSCTPSLSGRYVKDTALTASNTVGFTRNFATAGTYTLRSDTINGYYFTGTHTATAAGVQNVTLTGGGTPLALGTNNFTVRFGDGTTCPLAVTVIAGTTPPPAGCSAATVQGTYTAGTALNATNKVVIQHTYSTVGTFNVTTATVNGYSFSKSVNVTTAGIPTTVTLDGTGTPVAAGTNNFAVNFGDGTTPCPFSVTVVSGTTPPPPPATTYFPLTHNSYWTYFTNTLSTAPTDSLRRTITDSVMREGNRYKLFVEEDLMSPGDTTHFFFRRTGNDYVEYNFVDWYSEILFEEYLYGDILFLKEGLSTNQTWESATWTGTDADDGATKRLKYVFTCLDANTSATISGTTYNNVYKIRFKSQVAPGASGGTFADETYVWEALYAKGIGAISLKLSISGMPVFERPIKYHRVN